RTGSALGGAGVALAAVGRERLGLLVEPGGRAVAAVPRLDVQPQRRPGRAGTPAADHLAVDQQRAGTSEHRPQRLAAGGVGDRQVAVVLSRPADEAYPELPGTFATAIEDRTGTPVGVEIEYHEKDWHRQ
ncbi:MAG: hypothetical protein QXG03_14110, partial [Halalkalicoccus sp.]